MNMNAWLDEHPEVKVLPVQYRPAQTTMGWLQRRGVLFRVDPDGTITYPAMVHLAHFHDGYPLCWPMDREGAFSATRDEQAVTCTDCINFMKEESCQD